MPRKIMMPSPGASILSLNILNWRPSPRAAILLSITRVLDCASVRWDSRMQTAEVPRSAWQVSTSNSPKKCDLPEPRPPYAALYRAGTKSGSNILAVGILRMDNDALDSMDQFESAVIAILDRLCGLAPAAIQNGVGRGYPCCRRCILASHDADKDSERGLGMAACQRADFGEGFGHLEFAFPKPAARRLAGIGWRIAISCRTTLSPRLPMKSRPTLLDGRCQWWRNRIADDILMNHRMNRSEWLALLLLSVLWGGSFFFAAVLIKTLPFTIIFLRVGSPAVILNAFVKQSCGKPDSGLLHG